MIQNLELPQFPGECLAVTEDVPVCEAEFEYRPHGHSRLTIAWEVVAAKSFVPETEALQIATLLEQAQGFTGAFDLANLSGLSLLHRNGQWMPAGRSAPPSAADPAPSVNTVNNGNTGNGNTGNGNTPAPTEASYYPPPPPTDRDAPPAPRPFDFEPEEEKIRPVSTFADPVLVNEIKEGRTPESFEDWEATKNRLREEALARKKAEDDQAARLRVAPRAIPVTPSAPPETKKSPGKRITHGASMDLNDQIVRLLKRTARPVDGAYVARQMNLTPKAAYKRLQRLAQVGDVQCRQAKTKFNRTGYEFFVEAPGR